MFLLSPLRMEAVTCSYVCFKALSRSDKTPSSRTTEPRTHSSRSLYSRFVAVVVDLISYLDDFTSFRARSRVHRQEKMPFTKGCAATKEVQPITTHEMIPLGLTQRVEQRRGTNGEARVNRVLPRSMTAGIGVSVLRTMTAWKRRKRSGRMVTEDLCRLPGGSMGVERGCTSRLMGMTDLLRPTPCPPSISRLSTGE